MLEIIALVFLTRRIGRLALQKGLKPVTWKIYTIVAWFVCELIGILVAMSLFGQNNLFSIISIGIGFAFGGFLIVRAILEKKPDAFDEDINNITADDLKPPSNK
jgi:hypothetical protein